MSTFDGPPHSSPEPLERELRPSPTADAAAADAAAAAADAAAADARRVRFGAHTSGDATLPVNPSSQGPTVTMRRPSFDLEDLPPPPAPRSSPPSSPGSGSMRRANHPGPLHLGERIPGYAPPHAYGSSPLAAPLGYHAVPSREKLHMHETEQERSSSGDTRVEKQPVSGTAGPPEQDAVLPAGPLEGMTVQELDQRGLDGSAMVAFQQELQNIQQQGTPGAISADGTAESSHHSPQPRPDEAVPTEPPSGATTPGTPGSYAATEDSDFDYVPMISGEVDGMPMPVRKSGTEEGNLIRRATKFLRRRRGDGGSDADDEDMDVEKSPADASGPTNTKSVPVQTQTGLRGGPHKSRPSRYERQAARLVKSHRVMLGLGGQGGNDSSSDIGGPDAGASSRAEAPSSGVLGNLLKLYEQQQREQAKAMGAASSDAEGAGTSGVAESEVDDSRSPSHLNRVTRRPMNMAHSALSYAPQAPGKVGQVARHGATVLSQDVGLAYDFEERPRAARSSAGVVGALVATTGNLIGVVSPAQAQLGPNPFRPGFTLDRYLLPEMNAKTLRRTAKIVAEASGTHPKRNNRSTATTVQAWQTGSVTPGAMSPGGTMHARATSSAHSHSQSMEEMHSLPSTSVGGKMEKSMSSFGDSTMTAGKRSMLSQAGHTFAHPMSVLHRRNHSSVMTPGGMSEEGDYFGPMAPGGRKVKSDKAEWQRKVRKRAKRQKKEEIYITLHVAAILQRQEFLLKLCRALMMFGAPTHRIETQIQMTAKILDVSCRCVYFPSLMLISFGDDLTHTSDTRFIKQPGGTDLYRLTDMHKIYHSVIHDKVGVEEASKQLDELMRRKPLINRFWTVIIGGLCSAMICAGPMGFNGSFVDCLLAFPLGCLLVLAQTTIKAEVFSNVFEICFAGINSFIGAAAYQNGGSYFCYASVTPASIVLILPGMMFLQGSLELQSKSIISGSVRLVYAVLYSLFLGFGLSVGAAMWTFLSGKVIDAGQDSSCSALHQKHTEWYLGSIGMKWAFLTVPMYSICLALRNSAKPTRKEFWVMVLISIAGWCVNKFSSKRATLKHRSDFTAMLASLTIGVASSVYGLVFDGRSYVVAVPGILYLLPSGWSAQGGLADYANTDSSTTANASVSSGFQVAETLLSVALGLSVGLFSATLITWTLGGRRARGGGMFSF